MLDFFFSHKTSVKCAIFVHDFALKMRTKKHNVPKARSTYKTRPKKYLTRLAFLGCIGIWSFFTYNIGSVELQSFIGATHTEPVSKESCDKYFGIR